MTDDRGSLARAPWRTVSTRTIYTNPWIRVREDVAEMPDGRRTLYGVVETPPAIGVLPFLDANTVVLVGQYRYVARKFLWEIPTGSAKPGESEIDAAGLADIRGNSRKSAEAPPVVWPEAGKPFPALIEEMKGTRVRSRQSIEKLATLDPRPLVFTHFRLGDLDLSQWWQLQAQHDGIHLRQIRDVKASPGFPTAHN